MLLPCLCQILTFTPTFIFKVQHQFKNQFKNRLCLFLFNQQSLPCLSRDTCSINLCFVQRSLTLTLSMSQKATMQIFCIFTLLTLVFDNIWLEVHYITVSSGTVHPCVLLSKKANPKLFPRVPPTVSWKQQHKC